VNNAKKEPAKLKPEQNKYLVATCRHYLVPWEAASFSHHRHIIAMN